MRQPAELHPITLQFLDPDSERSYLDSFRERAESYARWTFLVAIVIWMGFSFWDHWMLPPKLTFDQTDEADALKTGAIFFKAPLLDALWK